MSKPKHDFNATAPGGFVHMCLDIRGALRWPDNMLRGLVNDEKGRPCTSTQARDYLLDRLAEGKRVLPMGACENFDFQEGCLGHRTSPPGRTG